MGVQMRPIRVVLADSQPVFLDGLRAHAERTADLSIVSSVSSGTEAVTQALDQRPDVLVLDIRLGSFDGIDATRRIGRDVPDIAVLIVTAYQEEEHVSAAMAAGAGGYVTKHAEPEDILTAIRVVARGGFYVDAAIAPSVRRRLGASPVAHLFPQLTRRERDILELLVRDTGTADIARGLGITMKTVRNHVSNVLVKLAARTRPEAVRMAREAGLRLTAQVPRPAPADRGT